MNRRGFVFYAKPARRRAFVTRMLPRSSTWAEPASNYFYAMEFVEGETLENLIKRSGRLEVKLALEIATQVAAGLAAVHKQKLVHRDIKPSNIMVSVEGGGHYHGENNRPRVWRRRSNEPALKPRFQYPGALPGRRSLPVPSSSREFRSTSARTYTRWA